MVLAEYDEELHEKNIRAEEREDAREELVGLYKWLKTCGRDADAEAAMMGDKSQRDALLAEYQQHKDSIEKND